MENSSLSIVKAGWLFRLSSILKVWKKEWAVIYMNGTMNLFKSQDKYSSDKRINLPVECRNMLSCDECQVSPPQGKTRDCIFGFVSPDKTHWFAGESEDDVMVWRMVIDQFRGAAPPPQIIRPSSTPIYSEGPRYSPQNPYYYQRPYPQSPVIQGSNGSYVLPQTVIQHPDGTQTIYVNQGGVPYCQEHRCAASCCNCCYGYDGMGLGLATGVAAGALMFSPFMWGPMFWM